MKIILLEDGRVVLEEHSVRFIFPSKEAAVKFHSEQLKVRDDSYNRETLDRIKAL